MGRFCFGLSRVEMKSLFGKEDRREKIEEKNALQSFLFDAPLVEIRDAVVTLNECEGSRLAMPRLRTLAISRSRGGECRDSSTPRSCGYEVSAFAEGTGVKCSAQNDTIHFLPDGVFGLHSSIFSLQPVALLRRYHLIMCERRGVCSSGGVTNQMKSRGHAPAGPAVHV